MKKELQQYKEKYGHVPNNFYERFLYILKELKFPDKDINKIKEGIRKLTMAKWENMNFVFYFLPKATPRARYSGRTKVFYVKNASDNSRIFKEFMEAYENEAGVITTPTKLLVDLYLPIPASGMTKTEKMLAELKLIRPVSKPDWDNAGKTYSDMIQKHLLLEDSLIIDGRVRKFYSFKPRIEIKLQFMTKYDSKFTKKKIEGWKFYSDLEDKIIEKDHIV